MNGRDSLAYTSPDPAHQRSVESTRGKIFNPGTGFLCVFVSFLKHKKGRRTSLVLLCTSKHKAAQATALRWWLAISCDVRVCLGSTTWASCASSLPGSPSWGTPVLQAAPACQGIPAEHPCRAPQLPALPAALPWPLPWGRWKPGAHGSWTPSLWAARRFWLTSL